MDAVIFLKEKDRMCSHMSHCSDCPLNDLSEYNYEYSCDECENFEEMVDIVETWSKENPVFTNGDKFTEVFGILPETLLSSYYYGGLSEWFKKEYINNKE